MWSRRFVGGGDGYVEGFQFHDCVAALSSVAGTFWDGISNAEAQGENGEARRVKLNRIPPRASPFPPHLCVWKISPRLCKCGHRLPTLAAPRAFRQCSRVQDLRNTKRHLILVLVLGVALLAWQSLRRDQLTVYCAHDAVFAEAILRDFEKQTGIPVAIKFDTEATKSLGLAEQIIREAAHPRCDVFWNNELLGTLDLASRGLLDAHKGTGWQRIPAQFRDADGRWTGFAARLRVIIERSDMPRWDDARLNSGDLSRFAMAKPLYGTTLTHYTVLWHAWGAARLQQWHADTRRRGLREVPGNAQSKDTVAAGVCDAAFTDTDDFFEAKDAGKLVTMRPAQLESGETICIPNTVGIVRNAPHSENARKLADFLLSAQTELALARSKSRQIPLGPVDATQLPGEVRDLLPYAARGVPLTDLLTTRNECLAWLKGEYLK